MVWNATFSDFETPHFDNTFMSDLLSDGVKQIYELVNYLVFCNIFSVFGIFSNIINILVFCRQGLNSTVNISFTGVAVSDLCSLVTLLWFNVCVNPLFVNSDVPMAPSEVQHLTGGFPHACFARITCWITVYITAERCLCIVSPLKIKQIITTKRATSIIVGIYIIMIASLLPEYTTMYIGWRQYSEKNRSIIGLIRTKENDKVSGLTFLLYAIYILVSFFAVIFFTTILVVKLKQKTKWREESTFDDKQSNTISNRDKKTIRMVIMIAAVLIVCYLPSVLLSAAGFIVPGFFVVGQYSNVFFVTWSFAFVLDSINSSVNIILYYTMSSKYRQTLHEMMASKNSNT
ncbi:growth hormone secretagogue receptor type 1 [Biomphalaria pfeifferi]|uniref:Growth hormone secretagogue receptor type 1 n=1 Tax=Biomphalaria pfeifferi TaxID=112525 RepID=A0AAD8FAM9_BIOPF|nr:growth hormone secretagogue receptor type 1 [Biomphalaria pfeifferi]